VGGGGGGGGVGGVGVGGGGGWWGGWVKSRKENKERDIAELGPTLVNEYQKKRGRNSHWYGERKYVLLLLRNSKA